MHDPEKLDQLSPSGCVLPRPAAVVLVKTRRFSALERRSVGAAVTWDALAPGVVICQLAKGHRFSNDDQLTACRAVEAHPGATRLLDLGAGVGSVGLTALSRCAETATLCCVEAQRISHELCRRTVARNGLEHRVACVHADLRDFDGGRGYDLITGSPPYFDPRDGVPSAHDQKAYCRLEYRGGLDEYCAAAARSLARGGTFAWVMAAADGRNDACPARHGLVVIDRVDVVFKAGRPPHICVVVACRRDDARARRAASRSTLTLRDAAGRRTLDYRVWQERMHLPPSTPPGAVRAALERLAAAACESERRAAVDAATALGMRPTPGSPELRTALAALGAGS